MNYSVAGLCHFSQYSGGGAGVNDAAFHKCWALHCSFKSCENTSLLAASIASSKSDGILLYQVLLKFRMLFRLYITSSLLPAPLTFIGSQGPSDEKEHSVGVNLDGWINCHCLSVIGKLPVH